VSRWCLFAAFSCAFLAGALGSAHEGRAADGARGLPLEVGKRWELVSPAGGQRMSLEVTGREGEAYVVQWRNPFVDSRFHFVLAGGKVFLAGLDMGTGLARMPQGTLYFDLDAAQGQQWSNALGTVTVLAKGKSVGGHSNGTEFRLTDPKGAQTFWTLSPDGGFLAFGQGPSAFVLTGAPATAARDAGARVAPAPPAGSARAGGASGGRVLIGLDSNPPPNEGYDDRSKRNRARMAAQTGVNYVYTHPKWTEVERSAGRFDFSEIDFKIRLAEEHGHPVSLNLRVIDTNQRAIPSAYANWRFTDERMAQRLIEVLRAIAPRTKGRVQWIAIGNEANNYFDGHKGEIGDYAQLIQRVLPTVRELFPGAQFTINFTHAVVPALHTTYAPLTSLCDILSFTYYPLNADFTFQDPGNAARDVRDMVRAAGDKRVLFQEIGYASSTVVNSSEAKQAEFMANVFQALRDHRDRVIAANFVWMSDLPQSVVDDLGKYYGLGNAAKFKAFLGSLGYWDRDGRPKKAWEIFQREATRM
jgi:hypothetical protein